MGAARDQLVWADLDGRRYSAIGTDKALIIYYENAFYDITPLDTAITGATFTTVNTSPTVTVNKVAHGLSAGALITFTSVTPPVGAGYVAADFTTNTFEVVTVPSQDTFTITMAANAGTTVAADVDEFKAAAASTSITTVGCCLTAALGLNSVVDADADGIPVTVSLAGANGTGLIELTMTYAID